jgi:hypothetical protein
VAHHVHRDARLGASVLISGIWYEAYAGGTTRVSFEGRSIEYRSLAEISTALAAGYAAENSSARRPTITLVRFSREGAG